MFEIRRRIGGGKAGINLARRGAFEKMYSSHIYDCNETNNYI